jgi:preprotein translocase subunit SecE
MKRIINYVKESYYELVNKVSWPTLQEVTNSSVVVLTASVIIALVILAMDMAFGAQKFSLMQLIYSL